MTENNPHLQQLQASAALKSQLSPAVAQAAMENKLLSLTSSQRAEYYRHTCQRLGLDPSSQALDWLLNRDKRTQTDTLTLYAKRSASEQLRDHRHLSAEIKAREWGPDGHVYLVTARISDPSGRFEDAIGAVATAGLDPRDRANAIMTAETKAKRRGTLAFCGAGLLDETEVRTIDSATTLYTVSPSSPPIDTAPPPVVSEPMTSVGAIASSSAMVKGWRGITDGESNDVEALTIKDVTVKATRKPGLNKFYVTLSDGRVVSTLKEQLGTLAVQMCQSETPIRCVTTSTAKWGEELKELHALQAQDEQDATSVAVSSYDSTDNVPF